MGRRVLPYYEEQERLKKKVSAKLRKKMKERGESVSASDCPSCGMPMNHEGRGRISSDHCRYCSD